MKVEFSYFLKRNKFQCPNCLADFEVFDLLQKKMMHTNFDSTLRYTEFAEEDWETISLNINIGLEILNQYC